MRFVREALLAAAVAACVATGCGSSNQWSGFAPAEPGAADGGGGGALGDEEAGASGSSAPPDLSDDASSSGCAVRCSADLHSVVDCNGATLETCTGAEGCDLATAHCTNACAAATSNKQSVGCEYYAAYMESLPGEQGYCFAAFVANTWNTPAHVTVDYGSQSLDVASFARIPQGSGPSLTYQPFDAQGGIPPGQVAILFLVGAAGTPNVNGQGGAPCPVAGAVPSGVMKTGTAIGSSFHMKSDVPVVAYEINPYGGGSAAVTGSSLLLPTSAWDTNYVAVNAYDADVANPSMNILAMQDDTKVTMVPVADVAGAGGLPSGSSNQPMTFTLNAGQHAQFTQQAELTGSVIQADKPIGLLGGHACMRIPDGVYYCDHAEQMIPPVRALGREYVGVMQRPRKGEPAIWRVVGAVDGTTLDWSKNVGGPAALDRGQIAEFQTGDPFVVKSQDDQHPFMLFAYMSGSKWKPGMEGYGDPEFVLGVPPQQYMTQYVFFADPTYPETNLVLVRAKHPGNTDDVSLDCAGTLTGWSAIPGGPGGDDYEWTRVDLVTGDFHGVGNCSTGRHQITSNAPFGLWVWGWGTPETSIFTQNVSYGYPGGMNVQPINTVVIPPTPR
jgi:hypothetical protein